MKKNTEYTNYDKKNLKEKFLDDHNIENNIRNLKKDDVILILIRLKSKKLKISVFSKIICQ